MWWCGVLALFFAVCSAGAAQNTTDPLPSWNDSASKTAIVDFVTRVTRPGGPEFVPVAGRIAAFDNDGTLWGEQPVYVQVAFALDRVKTLAPRHPEWQQQQPFKGVLEGDMKAVAATGEKGLLGIIAATHAGHTTDEFETIVREWIGSARDSRIGRLMRALDEAPKRGWTVVDMQRDWKVIYPPQK